MAGFKWNGRDLVVKQTTYQYGECKQPAVVCFDNSDPTCSEKVGIPYGVLTVNLDDPLCEVMDPHGCFMQYIDVNNWPGIEDILEKEDWCRPLELPPTMSGFVAYPVYMFKGIEKVGDADEVHG